MKKLFCLAIALLMLLSSAALAEPVPVDENAALTREEIEIYLDSLCLAAMEDAGMEITNYDDGSSFVVFSGAVLQISDEELTETTVGLNAYLNEEQADPRGLYIGSSLDEVLGAYPNDNPALGGSYYDAVLFITGEKPEMSAGFLLREGQRVETVVYTVYSWQPDGVAISNVVYSLDNGFVSAIQVRASELMEEAEALESIQEIADMQEISEYFAYPVSMDNGEALAPFEREDLAITQLGQRVSDFLDLNAEDMIAALGNPSVDEWTEDSDGSFLRLMQWDGVSLLLKYDAQRKFTAVDSLTINDTILEGPRGVRVGDLLDSVIFRFRHAEVFGTEDAVSLYGDGQTLPYGVLSYTPESAEATYAFSMEDGRSVVWHMTFVIGELQSMTLMLR